ncbi:MAG: oligogalacturonate lyase family protein [Tepidisphaeraceae bacterium]
MKRTGLSVLLSLLAASTCLGQTTEPFVPGKVQTTPIPAEYVDPQTHLRVVHLSRYKTAYGSVVYFTYNPFSGDSRYALINDQYKDKWRYLYTYDFTSMTAKPLVTDRLTQNQVMVAKSGNVYYQSDNAAWVVPIAGGVPRKLCDLPARWAPGIGFTVNADETLLLGGSVDSEREPGKDLRNGPNVLFTIDLRTGELKVIHRDNKWFGHVQFSPTDPDLCMFCWEGNWAQVDRIWLVNPSKSVVDPQGNVTSNARVAFHRTEPGEMAGHEFWQPDGKAIWFQHSARSFGFRLASLDVATGKLTQYTIPAGFGGIHETFSPDGTFMIADGSGAKGNTNPGREKFLSKLTIPTDGSTELKAEHLVDLGANDYAVEPNPHVSPDNRWVIFTATLHGTAQAYAVELPQAK